MSATPATDPTGSANEYSEIPPPCVDSSGAAPMKALGGIFQIEALRRA